MLFMLIQLLLPEEALPNFRDLCMIIRSQHKQTLGQILRQTLELVPFVSEEKKKKTKISPFILREKNM